MNLFLLLVAALKILHSKSLHFMFKIIEKFGSLGKSNYLCSVLTLLATRSNGQLLIIKGTVLRKKS